MASLILTNEGLERLVFPIGQSIMLLGRNPQAGIFLDSADISTNHASITFLGGYYVLKDAGSTNGTYVNGVPTSEKILSDNDKIRIGPYEFQLELEKSNETVEIRMPIDKPANMTQGGMTYHRAVVLKEIKGKKDMPPVNIMMTSRHTPVQARVSTANNQNVSPLSEAVGRARVRAVVTTPKKKPILLIVISIGTTLLAVGVLAAWMVERNQIEKKLLAERNQAIEELKEAALLSHQREKNLELELAQKSETLQSVKEEAKKASDDLQGMNKRLSTLEGSPKEAPKPLPPAAPESAQAAAPKKPDSAPLKQPEPAKTAAAPGKPPAPPQLAPGELPLLEYPPEVALIQEIQLPLVVANKVAGSLKMPSGRTFKAIGAEETDVLVNFNGATTRIPKDKTNFQAALDKLNTVILEKNRKEAADREAATAQVQQEALRLESKKKEETLSFQITEILSEGIIGTTSTGVRVYLSGKEHIDHVPNEKWKGKVYAMGIIKKSPTSPPLRRYTTDIDGFIAFKTKGESDSEPVILGN